MIGKNAPQHHRQTRPSSRALHFNCLVEKNPICTCVCFYRRHTHNRCWTSTGETRCRFSFDCQIRQELCISFQFDWNHSTCVCVFACLLPQPKTFLVFSFRSVQSRPARKKPDGNSLSKTNSGHRRLPFRALNERYDGKIPISLFNACETERRIECCTQMQLAFKKRTNQYSGSCPLLSAHAAQELKH